MLDAHGVSEEDFLASYDMRAFAPVAVTVDLAIFTIRNGRFCLLLIKRGGHPFLGKWALPGGFVNTDESLDVAAGRELQEETGLTIEEGYLEQLKTYGSPTRDPRGFVTSVAYTALAPQVERPVAGDDAAEAHFFPVEDVLDESFELAFDHRTIITDALERVRAKIGYAAIAHYFLQDEEFTLSELRRVYELVWGVELTASNFRRKILSVPELLIPVGSRRTSDIGGGRASDLYRAGSVREIFPPLRVPGLTD